MLQTSRVVFFVLRLRLRVQTQIPIQRVALNEVCAHDTEILTSLNSDLGLRITPASAVADR